MAGLFESLKHKNIVFWKVFKLIYRTCLVMIGWFSMYYMFFDRTTGSKAFMFNYFTVQSNFWVIFFEMFLVIVTIFEICNDKKLDNKIILLFKYIVTSAITITFLVYHFILSPQISSSYPNFTMSFDTLIMHYIVPIMMIIDFLVFDHQRVLKWSSSFLILVMPLYYLIFAFIRAELGKPFPSLSGDPTDVSRFPYFFLDVDKIGWFSNGNGIGVIPWILIIFISLIGLGFAFYGIDSLLKLIYFRRQNK